MKRPALGTKLANLGAACEAVGDYQRVGRAILNRRYQHALADLARHFEMIFVVTESTRHPATSAVRRVDDQPLRFLQQPEFAAESDEGLLMAMAVDESASLERGGMKAGASRARNSSSRSALRESADKPGLCGNIAGNSSRKLNRQLGSRPTTLTPRSTNGASAFAASSNRRRAVSSIPWS